MKKYTLILGVALLYTGYYFFERNTETEYSTEPSMPYVQGAPAPHIIPWEMY